MGGSEPPTKGASDGWHIAKAIGLPNQYISSVAIDPTDPRTVYVTLAGYGRHWAPPGAVGENPSNVGTGHVFVSHDAGDHFTNISANLPDVPANAVMVHGSQLLVGTDLGAYISSSLSGGSWAVLGHGLPAAPIQTLRPKPGDPKTLVAATYGRGVYTYRFP